MRIRNRLAAYLWSDCAFIFSPVQFVCFSCLSPQWRFVGWYHGCLSTMLWLFKDLQRKDHGRVIRPQKCFIFPSKNSTMLNIQGSEHKVSAESFVRKMSALTSYLTRNQRNIITQVCDSLNFFMLFYFIPANPPPFTVSFLKNKNSLKHF